jgi:hypothetical protein
MKKIIVLLFLILAPQVHANRIESWYTYWSIGYANVGYPSELDAQMDMLASQPGVDHISISLDMLGVYRPSGNRQLWGIVVNGFGDRYQEGNDHLQLNGYLLAASGIGFAQRIGQGAFWRADVGLARYNMQTEFWGSESSMNSDWGVGALGGGGYAFPITDGTRVLLSGNYALRRINGQTTTTLGISIGGLF